eukprot:NODE_89_length_21781_cov_0.895836.p16 type:complete len:183 gc:universal NODE_89_length_21781_cov_0.895836:2246-1698(-)
MIGYTHFPILKMIPKYSQQKQQIQIGVANGLAYMHNNGIAHNDVKSANIILDSQFSPKLINFRMVKIISTTTRLSKQMSIVNWKSPEYWLFNENLVGRLNLYPFADIFSFAIVLGEMATGKIPWEKLEKNDIEKRILKGERPFTQQQFEPNLYFIINNAWQQKPKDRITINEILEQLKSIYY